MEGKLDPEINQSKKATQWYHHFPEGFAYGMEGEAGVGKDSGPIYSGAVTAANSHELIPAKDLMRRSA